MENKNLLPIRILHDFAARIEKLDLAYMLTGSMAMMAYAVYRFTADVDVVLELREADAKRIIETFEPDYYVPHNAVSRAILSNRMFNVIHQETAFKIDCVVKKTTEFQQTAFENRQKIDFYGGDIWVITKENLIISKLLWAKESRSEKQLTDVRNLVLSGIDKPYVENWTQKLEIFDLFEDCRKERNE